MHQTEISPRIAVIGSGYWGKNIIRNMAGLGHLDAVVENRPDAQAVARSLAPNARILSNFEEILNDDHIDGVMIATPAETHAELCLAALEAGKDLFSEKPLALRYEEGKKITELATAKERILMVGHLLEYHPAIRVMADMLQSKQLGRLFYIYSNRLNLGKIRQEENILWSFAPHDIAVILRLVKAMPFEVVATGGTYLQPNIPDVTVTQLLFDNGVRAHIFVSWLHPFKEQRLVVVGEKNIISFDDVNKELTLHHQRVNFENNRVPVPVRGEGESIPYSSEEPLALECQAFIEAIQTRHQPRTDGESALRVLQVLQAAQRSLVTNGRSVEI